MRKTNLQVCEHNKSTDSLNQRHKFFQQCSIDTSQQHQQHWYAQLHRWKRDRYLFEARVLQCDDECFLCHQRRSCSFCHSSAFIRVRSKQVHILHKRFYLLRNSPVIPCVKDKTTSSFLGGKWKSCSKKAFASWTKKKGAKNIWLHTKSQKKVA